MANTIQVPVTQSGLTQSINNAVRQMGTINVPVNINPSGFQNLAQPLGKITGLATEFEKSIAASNARVLAFGASVGIINGVQNALSDLVKSGIEVQKTLTEIGSISGQTGDQLRKFGNDIFDAAKNTGNSFKVASEAALEFSRQGLSAQETIKRTNDALTLSRFTNLSAAESVDTLTAAINTFSEAGLTSSEIINKLVAVDTKFAVSAEDLAKGISRAGSIAQEVGVNFDQLNAAITVAQEKTARGGSVIGNALKTIFTNIRSDKAVEALRAVGVESLNAQGQLKGAIPLLQELADKMKNMSGGERIQLLETVASKYNINILSSLLDDLNNANSKFGQAVKVSAGAGNEAYERLSVLNKTLAADINKATQSLTQFYAKLSEIGVTEGLANMLKFVNGLLDSLNKLLDSEGVGGNIARGLIKGLSDIFFSVGLPIIAAIFVKLTTDIAKFGVESLKTILGINQQVRERAALEQAVVNTLIKDQQVMANILAMGNDQVRQQQYLLQIYEAQIAAMQTVKNIGSAVAPGLMGAGLSAMSGTVTKRSAGGYLPAQEAADVRRGVGGANPSASVVAIPNFAFGGGKFGTMVANSSEYIVPNFANGGSAIFNQDMVKAYGLPAGAQKISAAGGFIPSFARYVYDSDRIEPDKNALLKAILASGAKKNLIVGPAGSGKSTYGATLGTFITNVSQLADASEVDILSAAARSKDGGMSKNFQQILAAVNSSGGKVSYLYAGNMDIYSRRVGRTESGAMAGDLRTGKELSRTLYAPMNQFDFISQVKGGASNFEMLKGAEGFIPNFAALDSDRYAALVGKKSNGVLKRESRWVSQDKDNKINVNSSFGPSNPNEVNGKLINFNVYGVPSSSEKEIEDIKRDLSESGKVQAVRLAQQMTGNALPSDLVQAKLAATFNPGSLSSFAGTIFEASVGSLLGDKSFKDYSEQTVTSAFDLNIAGNQKIKDAFNIHKEVEALEVKGSDTKTLMDSVAKKIYQVTEGQREAFSKRKIGYNEAKTLGMSRPLSNLSTLEVFETIAGKQQSTKFNSQSELENYLSTKYTKTFGNSIVAGSGQWSGKGSMGYVPNFALNPLTDAIHREMAAGLSPSQISITQDGRLRNAGNPSGLAVINSRDEPNGRIPNFAAGDITSDPTGTHWFVELPNGKRQSISRAAAQQMQAQQHVNQYNQLMGPASYAPGNAPAVTPTGSGSGGPNDPLVTTNRLMLAFGGLTMITAQLQSNLKDTDSGFAKLTIGLSQIAQSASGYGMIGGMLGEATKNKTGMLQRLSGYMGPAGIAAGLGIGAYQAYNDYQESELNRRASPFTKRLEDMMASASTPEQRLAFAEENKKQALEKFKKLQAEKTKEGFGIRIEDFGVTPIDVAKKELETAAKAVEDEKRRQKVQADLQKNQTKDQERQEAKTRAESGLYDQSGDKVLTGRVAIQTQLNKLALAFTEAQIKSDEKRFELQKNILENANKLTEFQTKQLQDSAAEESIVQEIQDTRRKTLEQFILEVGSSSSLSNAEKERLDALRGRLSAGKDMEDVQTEINNLEIKGVLNLTTQTEKTVSLQIGNEKILAAKLGQLQTTNAINSANTVELTLSKERLKTAQQTEEIEKNIRDTVRERIASIEQAQAGKYVPGAGASGVQTQLNAINSAIAKQAYATPSQIAERTRLTDLANRFRQEGQLNTEEQSRASARQDKLKKGYQTIIEGMALPDEGKNQLLNALSKAKSPEEFEKLFIAGRRQMDFDVSNPISENAKKISVASIIESTQLLNKLLKQNTEIEKVDNDEMRVKRDLLQQILGIEENTLAKRYESLRASGKGSLVGGLRAMDEIKNEVQNFPETFAYNTTNAFRDGMRDAIGAAISDSANLGQALQGVAQNFLKTMQNAFLQQASNNIMMAIMPKLGVQMPKTMATGGLVSGGSGYRDDVPAMLTGGEFVMTKSAVQKYGVGNLAKMNSGGIFLPGVRGGGEISGYDQLRAFANQTTTSGATDIMRGTGSSAYLSLEDQSAKLSRWALMNNDTIGQEVRSAQEQGLNLISQREAYRTQQRKAFQQQLVGTLLSAAVSYGAGKLTTPTPAYKGINIPKYSDSLMTNSPLVSGSTPFSGGPMAFGSFTKSFGFPGHAYGGPTDDTPAMLMSGEYVMSRGAARKYGTDFLNSMNSGRAPRFADGGAVDVTAADSSPSNKKATMNGDINISINVASNGSSDTKTQGGDQGSAGGIDYKKMSERIKAVVLETIQEEKRLGGALRR